MERVKVSVGDGYARWAAAYDGYSNPLVTLEEPIVRTLTADVAGLRALDSACGTGRHTVWLASRGADVIGVDRSAEMLAVARAKGVTAVEGDVAALPFEDGRFDLVLNALMMEHVPRAEPILAELRRVLAPGGRLVISVFHPAFLWKGVTPHFRAEDGKEYELPSHVHLPSEYVGGVLDLGMTLEAFVEPVVDDALIAAHPNMEKHRGLPLAIVLAARV